MTGLKKKFCASLPWTMEFRWYDLTGMHELSREVTVAVTLVEMGLAAHYQGFKVTLINKVTGKVFEKTFAFYDHLSQKDRADARPEYGGAFYVGCEFDWYIALPSKRALVEYTTLIQNFILEFDVKPV